MIGEENIKNDNKETDELTCCLSLSSFRQERGIGRDTQRRDVEMMKTKRGWEAKSQSLRHLRKFAD